MPRYDFRCTTCQWTYEAAIPFGSEELPPCPQCGKKAAERVISPPLGIHFHGSGFYKTDSRPAEKTKQPAAENNQAPATPKEKTASAPHPSPLPMGEGMTAPHPDPLPKGEGMTAPPPSPRGEGTPGTSTTGKKVV